MFESIPTDDAAARFRSAAFAPLAAIILTVAYLTLYPLLGRVPAILFWIVVATLLIGTIYGAIAIVRAWKGGRPRGITIGWLVGAIAIELLCARVLLWLTLPWL